MAKSIAERVYGPAAKYKVAQIDRAAEETKAWIAAAQEDVGQLTVTEILRAFDLRVRANHPELFGG